MSSKKPLPPYLRNQPSYDFEAGQAFLDSLDAAEPQSSAKPNDKKKSAGFLRTAGDFGLKIAQGVVDTGSMVVGAANLASGGLAGRGLRAIGYDPQASNEIIGDYLSDDQKQAEANVAKADGFVDSVAKHLDNPRAIMGGIAQSAPAMLNSMAVSRVLAQKIGLKAALTTAEGAAVHAAQLQAGRTSAQAAAAALSTESGKVAASQAVKAAGTRLIAAGAGTEGLQTAGKIADDSQAAGREYSDYALPALGAGVVTSAVSLGSGKLFGDAATQIATGSGTGVKGGMIARGAKGFLTEGLVEEAPQSYSEQVFTNIANGEKDITKGASAAAGAGFIIGGAQGGGMAVAQGRPKVPEAGALSRAANIGIDAENAQTAQTAQTAEASGKFTGMDALISAVQNEDNPSLVREIAQRQVQEQLNQPDSVEGVPANFAELLQQSNQQREQERIETRESWEGAKEQAAIELAEQDRIEQENRLRLPAPDMPMPEGALIDDNGTLRPQTYQDAAASQVAAAQREELGQSVPYGERGGVENVSVPSTPNVPEAPTYILHPSGKPFTNKIGAQTRLKQLGGNHTIVPYEGGFAIRKNESQPVTQVQEQQAATGVPEATAGSSQSEPAVIQPGDIMHPSGKPFTVKYPAIMTQRQSGGEIIKVDGGYIVRPPKQPSLEEIVAESQSEPTYEKGKTGAETARNKLDAENPFLSFLAKYGLKIDERSDVGGERGKARLIPGYGPLFRQNGLRLDELAQMAKEAGFLSQEQIDSETDNGGVNALSEMIGQALNNEVVPKGQSEPEVNLDVQMLDEATKLGLDTAGKTPDQVYDMIKAFHDQTLPPELNEVATDTEDNSALESDSTSVESSPQQDMDRVEDPALSQSETGDKESKKENTEIDLVNSDRSDAEYDDVPFSRAADQKNRFGFDVDELQLIVDEISAKWKNAPKINVVHMVEDLPFRAPSDVRGAYRNGQVYLVASALITRDQIESVLFHETLGHAGLRGFFGAEVAPALRSIAMKNRKIAEAAAVWRKNNTDIKGKRTDDQYHLVSIEEALADYVGTGRTINGVEKLLAAIQKGLRAIGLNSVADWMESATDAEVLAMLASARNHIEKGSEFSVFGERQAQVFSRQQSESEFFKGMGIETGATPNQEDQYFNEVSWKTYGTDKKTGLPTWASDKLSLQSPRDVTQAHDVFYAPQNKERAVKYDIHDAQGKKVGYTVIELDGDMPKQLLDIEIDKDQRGNKHAENTVAALAADAGELGIWRIVDSARSWWDRIGTRTVDEYDGAINFKDYADARASREDKSGLGETVNKSDDPALFSRTKTVGDNSRTRTPEQLKAFENVGRTVQVPTLKERFNKMTENLGKKLAQGIVDQFAPIKDLSEEAYGLMRLSKGASGAFEAMLKGGQLKLSDGVYDFDDAKRGGVIDRLLAPLQGESDDFMWWIAGNRAEALSGQGKENLFTPSDIKAFKSLADGQTSFEYTIQHGIQKGKKTRDRTTIYNDSLKTFNEFNKNTLDMAEQSGLIDAESRKLWESEFYIPFYRVNEESDDGVRGMNIKSGVVRQQAFKKLKGGSDKLNSDLLENTLMNWAHLLDASAKNRAAKASLEAAAKVGAATPADSSTKKTVWYMDSGDKKYYTVEDPHLLTAIQGLEYAGMRSPIMNAMSVMKHAMTVGVTASPFFKIRNLIRDSVSAIAISGLDYNPGKNIKEGWKLTNQKSDEYFRLLAGGGTIHFGAMLEGSEAKRVRKLVESGVDESSILLDDNAVKAFYRNHISPVVDAYNELGNRGESINRASLYDQLIKQGKSHAEASLMARDLMDFSMQGAWTSVRFLTQVVPFMNARLQGLYKLGRSASEDPKRFGIVLGAVAAASISLMLAYADDDDWKKREDWDRDNFWWFKVGGTAFRIPKPFEIGAIGTLAERGVEYFTQDEMTGERFMDRFKHLMLDSLSMNPIPQMIKPVIDVYANKDSFTGRPIESMSMERLRSDYRFNGSTSMLARAASTAGNAATGDKFLSPVQIDHLIRGYFGWLGTFAVGGVDRFVRPLTNEPDKATADYVKLLSGGIVADTKSASSRYVAQMYEQAKIVDEAYGTWRMLVKTGKLDEAKEFAADNADKLRRYKGLQNVKRSVSTLNEQIRVVERSNLSSDEKREKINLIQQRKDNIARRASLQKAI